MDSEDNEQHDSKRVRRSPPEEKVPEEKQPEERGLVDLAMADRILPGEQRQFTASVAPSERSDSSTSLGRIDLGTLTLGTAGTSTMQRNKAW